MIDCRTGCVGGAVPPVLSSSGVRTQIVPSWPSQRGGGGGAMRYSALTHATHGDRIERPLSAPRPSPARPARPLGSGRTPARPLRPEGTMPTVSGLRSKPSRARVRGLGAMALERACKEGLRGQNAPLARSAGERRVGVVLRAVGTVAGSRRTRMRAPQPHLAALLAAPEASARTRAAGKQRHAARWQP